MKKLVFFLILLQSTIALPTTSTNGITGLWSPALSNTAKTTYSCSTIEGKCATSSTQTITITNPQVISVISFVAPVAALPIVTIGTQVWINKKLDVTTYHDGTPIPQVTDTAAWVNLITGAWCYYNIDPANEAIYGKLYNWYAVAGIHDTDLNTFNKTHAPAGYHIPNDAECTTLITFLGADRVGGGKMKTTILWKSLNTAATNSSVFAGFPVGNRTSTGGNFINLTNYGVLWGVKACGTLNAWCHYLFYEDGYAYRLDEGKRGSFSVRCFRD